MAGFLRRKTKHEDVSSPTTRTASPISTPLFARFATSAQNLNDPSVNQRVVSSPMLLSGGVRKDNPVINRGYASSSISVVGKDPDVSKQRNQKPPTSFQYDEPVPPALIRPRSSVDKPLPLPSSSRGPPPVTQIKQPLRSRTSFVISPEKPLPVPGQQRRAVTMENTSNGRKLSLQTTFPPPRDVSRSPIITNLLDDEFELTPQDPTPKPSRQPLNDNITGVNDLNGTIRTAQPNGHLNSPQPSDLDLPPELGLFQKFITESSPTDLTKSAQLVASEKFAGQVLASSGRRSSVTEDNPSITPQPSKFDFATNINTTTPVAPSPPPPAAPPPIATKFPSVPPPQQSLRLDMGNTTSALNGHSHNLYSSPIDGFQASLAFINPLPNKSLAQFGSLNPQLPLKRPMTTSSPQLPRPTPSASVPTISKPSRMNDHFQQSPFLNQPQANPIPSLRKSPSLLASSSPVQGKARIFTAMAAADNGVNNNTPPKQPFTNDLETSMGYAARPYEQQQRQQHQLRPEFTYPNINQNRPPIQNGYRPPPLLASQPPQPTLPLNASAVQPSFVSDQQQQLPYQQSGVRTPRVNGNRPLPTSSSQLQLGDRQHSISTQSPPRLRKLSKARQPSDVTMMLPNGSSTSIVSNSVESLHKVHQHGGHRTLAKVPPPPPPPQPILPKVDESIQLDEDIIRNAGIPLDDDPFARVEGVKMLKPTTPPPRENSLKRHRSKDPKGQSSSESVIAGEAKLFTDDEGNASPRDDQHSDSAKTNASNHGSPPQSPEGKRREKKERKERERQRRAREEATEVPRTPVAVTHLELMPEEASIEQKTFPLAQLLGYPQLLSALLSFGSFYEWCILSSVSKEIRIMLVQSPRLREEVLERFLGTVGYLRWSWEDREPLSLSLQDLSDYMRGVSTPSHEYARVAKMYVHSLSMHPTHRDPSLNETVQSLTTSARGYTRVVLRLRAQAEKEASLASSNPLRSPSSVVSSVVGGRPRTTPSRASSRAPSPTMSNYSHGQYGYQPSASQNTSQTNLVFRSALFRLRRAPLLRVFVPSPEGDWLSDRSVLECEAECKRAGVVHLMRMGDVVWDIAVGDEGNVGRLVWDGSYLVDLDYTYNPIGDLPKYIPTLAFPPSYFHRVIRTGATASNPIVHIDISPWGEEIATNLQLLQDRVKTETPQGAHHNVVRWVHRSSFVIRPPARVMQRGPGVNSRGRPHTPRIPIPDTDNLFIDSGWYGTIVVDTEGTNEALADLQDRCGPRAFPPRPRPMNAMSKAQIENRKVFRILREKSRPSEIWIKAVGMKERLL